MSLGVRHHPSDVLNQAEITPYKLALRDSLDMALYYFGELESAALKALGAQDRTAAAERLTQDMLDKQGQAQREVFDHLDAFLSAFARVSLLLFPAASSAFAKRRAETMQRCLDLDESSMLADRVLRGSWMHHDERSDWAVQDNVGRSSQTFSRSTAHPKEKLKAFLRVIELDTLIVHYRDRDGALRQADVRKLASELKALDAKRVGAFHGLPVPDDV